MTCNVLMNVDKPTVLPNSLLTASSTLNLQSTAADGRLDNALSSWIPGIIDNNQWHQVDFQTPQNLSGVITQGSPNTERWVSSFAIMTSMDGLTFFPVTNVDGSVVMFNANTNKDTAIKNYFPHTLVARFVRLIPQTWAPTGPGLRVNYIGCFSSAIPTLHTVPTSILLPPTTPLIYIETPPVINSPTPTPQVTSAPQVTYDLLCSKNMGVQDQRIVLDSQITASSSASNHGPELGRLSEYYEGSWMPLLTDQEPYIQVDFQDLKFLSGVITQGEGQKDSWTSEYQVYLSTNGKDFYPYSDRQDGIPKVFSANDDNNTPRTNYFVKNIIARYIRIVPIGSHRDVSLRFEILGCNPNPISQVTIRIPLYVYTTSPVPSTLTPSIHQGGSTQSPTPPTLTTPAGK
uniref:F5/8 type C domain-containing protein n=1 Tax=Biomphalaria glabrata TaxID=6526 RepID=A0A2C9KVW4_BIOGL